MSATARYFAPFQSLEELQEILSDKAHQPPHTFVLGGGSNVLLTKDVDGLVIKNEIDGIDVVKEDDDYVYVKAGGGVNWHRFVMYCVENGFSGAENLSLIPGNVGASPMQNIGAYGVEIKDIFHELEAYHLGDKNLQTFSLSDCDFGYRESVFKRKRKGEFIITTVTYRLNKKPVFHTSYGAIQQELEKMGVADLNIKAISDAVIRIRSSKLPDPKQVGNAGSFFKNPAVKKEHLATIQQSFPDVPAFPLDDNHVKIPAGWLIEQCGWKGFRRGDAGCYPKQALVLVNYGNASGSEIFALSEEILQSVNNRFGVVLEREVNIL